MIIRFSVANFRSFHEPTELLMTPGRERQHSQRVPRHGGIHQRILPTAAIYGANASGKSNLTEALSFLQDLVVIGVEPKKLIPRHYFRLDPDAAQQPTRLEIDFVAPDDKVYRYTLSVTDREVVFEELLHVRPSSEEAVFRRHAGEKRFEVSGLEAMADDPERRAFFRFSAEGTRANQPFLHETLDRDIHELSSVLTWFSACLTVIGPDHRPMNLEDIVVGDDQFRYFLRSHLRGADTGIDDIVTQDRPLDEVDDIPEQMREAIREQLKENETKLVRAGMRGAVRYLVRYRDGQIWACQMRATRRLANGGSVPFDPDDESDGTRRYMDLALAFYALSVRDSRHVFVVDELDRSLHPVLCRSAIEEFLDGCHAQSRGQFIITTHDVTLMTQDVFRRDELWLMEKNYEGASQLLSLGEFKDLRNDKDLRRNYLQGRFGGVPVVHQRPKHEVEHSMA